MFRTYNTFFKVSSFSKIIFRMTLYLPLTSNELEYTMYKLSPTQKQFLQSWRKRPCLIRHAWWHLCPPTTLGSWNQPYSPQTLSPTSYCRQGLCDSHHHIDLLFLRKLFQAQSGEKEFHLLLSPPEVWAVKSLEFFNMHKLNRTIHNYSSIDNDGCVYIDAVWTSIWVNITTLIWTSLFVTIFMK